MFNYRISFQFARPSVSCVATSLKAFGKGHSSSSAAIQRSVGRSAAIIAYMHVETQVFKRSF